MNNSKLQSKITCQCAVNKTIVATTSSLSKSNNVTENIASLNSFKFSSEYHNSALGLVYYNYRHYNPNDGRWLSRDPIVEKGGYNLYAVKINNMILFYDLLGLFGPSIPCSRCGCDRNACGCNKPPLIIIIAPGIINSAYDAYEYFKSNKGGTVQAGAVLINDIKNSLGYKNFVENIIDVKTKKELKTADCCKTSGFFPRNGYKGFDTKTSSVGHITLYFDETKLNWTASKVDANCQRIVTGTINLNFSFSDEYKFVYDNEDKWTIITDVIPSIIAGTGTNYMITGRFSETRTLSISQNCRG